MKTDTIPRAACLVLLAASGLVATATAAAAPIYLKGGQCIQIGSQEVCAMSVDKPGGAGGFLTQHLCRYGLHPGTEIPNLKNHALFQLVTTPAGTKSETLVRQFGINDADKEACQKEADRLNAVKP